MAKIVGDSITVTSVRGKGLVTRYYLDGEEVTERKYRRRHPVRAEAPALVTFKKQKSVALAVHPSQRGEAADDAAKRGVPTEFTADGCPVFESRSHRKKYMQAYGYFDRDAGYGDAAPRFHKGKAPPPSRIRELAHRLAERINRRNESKLVRR